MKIHEHILYILKTKSNFTLLLYLHFLGIGECYLNAFNSLKV